MHLQEITEAIRAIANSEFTVEEIHDAFAGKFGFVGGTDLSDLESASEALARVVHYAKRVRDAY